MLANPGTLGSSLQVFFEALIHFLFSRTFFNNYKGRLKGGDVKYILLMTKEEIKDFKKFLHEKNIFLMFTQNYRNYRLTINPPTWEAYLENARVENVIPQAFVYPKSIYDKDFWLAMHEEWQKRISAKRAVYREATQLEYLDLEIIDVKSRTSCLGLPKNTCSLSLRGGKRFTLNMDDSKRVAKKLSTHMLLTRSRQTADVVLMFNRQKGIEVKFRPGTASLQFNNTELASRLMELLDLDASQDYFLLNIEQLSETKDYLLFTIKKKEKE